MSIGVPVSANCTKALNTTVFIASIHGGLYALETVLECCVVGPIGRRCKEDDIISCNRNAVENAGTKQISRHEKEVKDTGIQEYSCRVPNTSILNVRQARNTPKTYKISS